MVSGPSLEPTSSRAEPRVGPVVRLRTILLTASFAGAVWWAWPRAMSAIELHSTATLFADYGLCMVGPTGPQLLRDNPAEFKRLVHRRLVASQPEERPFASCAAAAQELTQIDRVGAAHQATAESFVEFGEAAADRAQQGAAELNLDQLRVTTRRLAQLSEGAWPFSREGYTLLVRPSLGAKEAMHPVAAPLPALGRGLPAENERYRSVRRSRNGWALAWGTGANILVFESRDGGLSFASTVGPSSFLAEFSERCSGGDGAFRFGMSEDSRLLEIVSQAPKEALHTAALGSADQAVFTASCDSRAAAVGLESEKGGRVYRLCHRGAGCEPLTLPRLGKHEIDARYAVDLARIDGATVLSVARQGVVRVTSSRDDGRTWTPFTVAYDRGSDPALRDLPVPTHLLPLGSRLMLYAGSKDPRQNYPVLASDDLGASWRTPPVAARVAESPPRGTRR